MKAMNVDCVCFMGHKSLFGPQGIGWFVISPELEKNVDSFIQGGTGSISDLEVQPSFMPDKFESGTQNIVGIFGLKAALDFLNEKGIENIRKEEVELFRYFYNRLVEIDQNEDDFEIISKNKIEARTAIISLDFKNIDNAEVSYILQSEYNIQNRCGLHCSPSAHQFYGTFPQGTVRFSLGYFNNKEDIDYTCSCIYEILKKI
ncbi:MAG: aminotransferase class V-fold PLP-dependent enzyme [Proteocatella sp.]